MTGWYSACFMFMFIGTLFNAYANTTLEDDNSLSHDDAVMNWVFGYMWSPLALVVAAKFRRKIVAWAIGRSQNKMKKKVSTK